VSAGPAGLRAFVRARARRPFHPGGDSVYETPSLTRFGTLRELTLCGAQAPLDGGPAMGNGSTNFNCDPGGGGGHS
jgi:hypothetical protein